MAAIIKRTFVSQVFTTGQKAAVEYCGNNYLVTVNSMLVSGTPEGVTSQRGCLVADTSFVFEAAHNSAIKITNQKTSTINSICSRRRSSVSEVGHRRLDKQFEDIFRRASPAECSRNPWFSASASARRGLLLTVRRAGQALLAREIGAMVRESPRSSTGRR